jgi:hypothetical protein
MIEYLRKDNAGLDITYNTTGASAASVLFTVSDLDSGLELQTGSAVAISASSFTVSLSSTTTQYDRNIKIIYQEINPSASFVNTIYAGLVRPYATPERIRELADIPSSASATNLQKLEKMARLSIDSFLGFGFYKEYRSIDVYGNNTDILQFNDHIISVSKIYEDDILTYEIGSETYEFEYPIEIGTSGDRIKIVNTSEKNKEMLEYPKFSVFHYDGQFKKSYLYKVEGVFGYEYVPSDIELATALLVEDYLCNDFNIRNKNIAQLSNDSYDIKYGSDAATGTGNLMVDNLLAKYLQPRYLVI